MVKLKSQLSKQKLRNRGNLCLKLLSTMILNLIDCANSSMKHTGEITWSLEILKSATEREIIAAVDYHIVLNQPIPTPECAPISEFIIVFI